MGELRLAKQRIGELEKLEALQKDEVWARSCRAIMYILKTIAPNSITRTLKCNLVLHKNYVFTSKSTAFYVYFCLVNSIIIP